MLHRTDHRSRLIGIVLAVALVGTGRRVAEARADDDLDPVQVIADVTVIDAECRTTDAMFGAVLRYGESRGVRAIDILPLGRRRAAFEAASERRRASTSREEICGSLLASYRHLFPDWFSTRNE